MLFIHILLSWQLYTILWFFEAESYFAELLLLGYVVFGCLLSDVVAVCYSIVY